ncbi:zinc-ribbon domain-containing protein [Loigolactobacillus bifermentans]|nr:zinc ribbon domain-containing protein [Loigolactobacillus bifermentans]QGG60740.1 zinc-ribbon domain-containing protein [Loigolactobacillus bifermentans]
MIKCQKCGTLNQPQAKFCENCGQPLAQATAQVRTPTVQPKQQANYWPWFIGGGVAVIAIVATVFFLTRPDNTQQTQATTTADSSSVVASSDSAATTSAATNASTSTKKATNATVVLSDRQKSKINQKMLDWADSRAQTAHLAVSDYYFNHGAAGQGDWYAVTSDGRVQVQNQENPGHSGFKLHAIGGLVFYSSQDGTTGIDHHLMGTTAEGYTTNMNFNKTVTKYLFLDNGSVYELKLGNGATVDPITGFGELNNHGQTGGSSAITTDKTFLPSADTSAISTLQQILKQYQS